MMVQLLTGASSWIIMNDEALFMMIRLLGRIFGSNLCSNYSSQSSCRDSHLFSSWNERWAEWYWESNPCSKNNQTCPPNLQVDVSFPLRYPITVSSSTQAKSYPSWELPHVSSRKTTGFFYQFYFAPSCASKRSSIWLLNDSLIVPSIINLVLETHFLLYTGQNKYLLFLSIL